MIAPPHEAATDVVSSVATAVVRDPMPPAIPPAKDGPRRAWWHPVLTLPEFRHWSTCDDADCQVCDELWKPVARYLFDRQERAA